MNPLHTKYIKRNKAINYLILQVRCGNWKDKNIYSHEFITENTKAKVSLEVELQTELSISLGLNQTIGRFSKTSVSAGKTIPLMVWSESFPFFRQRDAKHFHM